MRSPMFMGGSRFKCRARERDLGAALVIVLACIVILTGLIVAFLGHAIMETQVSGASAEQASATLFARGAVDSVISETVQEITAGSTPFYPSGSDVRDPNCFYFPVANAAMVPYRMDPGAPPNVYKRSSWNEAFYQGGFYNTAWPAPTWAAHYSTTNVDLSGRTITMARWNAPLLMPKLNTTVTDLTPATGFIPPDWIYMTRTAGPVTTWNANLSPSLASGTLNPNQVVGRYAYVVYDEGGLLDANAAGYPSTIAASAMRQKISEACADLTQIGLQTSDITSLLAWRNPNNAGSSNAYFNYVYGPANPAIVNATGEATNGFLTPAAGERVFTSRQQLITFLTQYVASGTVTTEQRLQGALPYLTHFSRELNAPSWYPQTNAASSGSWAYLYNSTNSPSTTTNIFAPLQRASGTFTDATNSLVTLPNQSVAYSRFPLSRLSWLGTAGPNGATAAQILESFGLSWDSANYAWQYFGSDGSGSVQSTIKPLNQITGRAPNFFELLKAGILSGSVGMYAIDTLTVTTIDSRYLTTTAADQHIMQIGLSVMDQVSTSPLPNRIEFGANTGTLALYGTKNLPYLYKMTFSPYRSSSDPNNLQAWLEPIFWNPYVTGATATSNLSLQLAFANGTAVAWAHDLNPSVNPPTGVYDNWPTSPALGTSGNTSSGTITIAETSAGTLSALTTNPIFMIKLNGTHSSVSGVQNTLIAAPSTYLYYGFWLGQRQFPVPDNGSNNYCYICSPSFAPTSAASQTPPQFILKANYGGGNYQEVQRMNFSTNTAGSWATDYQYQSYSQITNQFTFPGRHYQFYTFPDPRTGRFGLNFNFFAGYNATTFQYNNVTTNYLNEISSGTWTTYSSPSQNFNGAIYSLPTTNSTLGGLSYGTTSWGNTGSAYRFADNSSLYASGSVQLPAYLDTDGVQRRGDAWYNIFSLGLNIENTLPMRTDALTPSGYPAYRPVLLERNFDSVGELGYAFRDMPWRSIDFCTTNSADAGLLDFFTVNDGYAGNTNSPVVAGRVDLNTAQPPVLEAMLNGAYRAQLDPTYDISSSDAGLIATNVAQITSGQPLLNKSEIATRLAPNDPTVQPTATSEPGIDTNIKERREALVRALASVGQVRTWNLMIDVIAQTGHMPPNASGFNNFVATAEQRYWAHVAIDRFTGQVVSMQLEPVSQ